jgi:hypothetical protein
MSISPQSEHPEPGTPLTVGQVLQALAGCDYDKPVTAECWADPRDEMSEYPTCYVVDVVPIDGSLHLVVVAD